VFLPIQPTPAAAASSRSNNGAVSTQILVAKGSTNSARIRSTMTVSLSFRTM
jgi:hypothetical protein